MEDVRSGQMVAKNGRAMGLRTHNGVQPRREQSLLVS